MRQHGPCFTQLVDSLLRATLLAGRFLSRSSSNISSILDGQGGGGLVYSVHRPTYSAHRPTRRTVRKLLTRQSPRFINSLLHRIGEVLLLQKEVAMSNKIAFELARMTEEVTAFKIAELTDIELDAVAGGLLAAGKEQASGVRSAG